MRICAPSTAAAVCFCFALCACAGDGFRWRIDEVNELARPDLPGTDGLSAIVWVSNTTYIAATDWDCILWELDLPHDPVSGKIHSCGMKKLSVPSLTLDVEGIALDPLNGSLWIADERAVTIRQHAPSRDRADGS